jgi:amidohydrolase
MPNLPLQVFSAALRDKLTDLRHDLHRHPELALQEFRTADRLCGELAQLSPSTVDRLTGTGVRARIPGTNNGLKAVAIRGDIDALPITEETGVHFASVNRGVMHACGHDVHAAWTVGAAHLLSDEPACGDVVIILQPAEETAQGAQAMIEAGALDGVSAIFGAHVDLRFEIGAVVAQAGNVAGSADEFFIELRGKGTHAARPHEGADPIVGAASLVTALQTIVSRRIAPGVPAVVTVGTITAGTATNVVPHSAQISGTLRAADHETRMKLQSHVQEIAAHVARVHGLLAECRVKSGTPPLVNPPEVIRWARDAVRRTLGDAACFDLPAPNLGGEDFAFYLERITGCFLRIGGRLPDQNPVPAHNPRFLPDDQAVLAGAVVLAELARTASREVNRIS